MLLAETIVLRRNNLAQPDYDVVNKQPDGRERCVGRIFLSNPGAYDSCPWLWIVEFRHRSSRAEPHQGRSETLQQAMEACRKCWESADELIK